MIAVLGRGKSLKKYKEFSHLFKKVYIVNSFSKEIDKIGKKHLINKDIIHIAARSKLDSLSRKEYKSLNIKKVLTLCHHRGQFFTGGGKDCSKFYPKWIDLMMVPDCMKNRGFPLAEWDEILNMVKKFDNYKEVVKFLEENPTKVMKKRKISDRATRRWPTSGSYAVDVALNYDNDKGQDIYLFGIDFYKTLSLTRPKWDYQTTVDDKKPMRVGLDKMKDNSSGMNSVRVMKYFIGELVREFSDVNFYTACNLVDYNLKNWSFI
jgi:hypothetical protein